MFPSIHNGNTRIAYFYDHIENLGDICSLQSLRVVGGERSTEREILKLYTEVAVVSETLARAP